MWGFRSKLTRLKQISSRFYSVGIINGSRNITSSQLALLRSAVNYRCNTPHIYLTPQKLGNISVYSEVKKCPHSSISVWNPSTCYGNNNNNSNNNNNDLNCYHMYSELIDISNYPIIFGSLDDFIINRKIFNRLLRKRRDFAIITSDELDSQPAYQQFLTKRENFILYHFNYLGSCLVSRDSNSKIIFSSITSYVI